jgi:hypothetical protein
MSHAVEGFDDSGLDPADLLAALAAAHGPAVAAIGDPVMAVLIDRRALPWPDFLAWLAAYARRRGARGLAWDDAEPSAAGMATLEYEL